MKFQKVLHVFVHSRFVIKSATKNKNSLEKFVAAVKHSHILGVKKNKKTIH